MTAYQPKTGRACSCKPGVQRDNCPNCEGTGMQIDFAAIRAAVRRNPIRPKPSECPHCEYDRRFPGFEAGGWIQQDNNGSIVSCPLCNPNGEERRS